MGTNFSRIPTEKRVKEKKVDLNQFLRIMELTPQNIEQDFCFIKKGEFEYMTPWDHFMNDMKVHLGKRSAGWKFGWNFHNNKYYSNKEELLSFIRSGRVVDEYGTEIDVEEFIEMALNWHKDDGLVVNSDYFKGQREKHPLGEFFDHPDYHDLDVDGLRVSSSTEFS